MALFSFNDLERVHNDGISKFLTPVKYNSGVLQGAVSGGIDSFTKLMLLFNDANGNNVIYDSSFNNRTFTTVGTPYLTSTTSPFSGLSSCYFDGSSYIWFPTSTDFDCGSSSYTIDGWIKTTMSGTGFVLHRGDSAGTPGSTTIILSMSGGFLQFTPDYYNYSSQKVISSTAAVNDNNWHYFVAQVINGTGYLYIDGVLNNSAAGAGFSISISQPVAIGSMYNNANKYVGYMSNIRFSVGIARYGASFVNPETLSSSTTKAFDNDVYTKVLLHFNGTNNSTNIIDDSSYNNSFTCFGNAKTSVTQSKFNGSAISFDGTNSYISTTNNIANLRFGNGAFTVEFWMMLNALTAVATYITTDDLNSAVYWFDMYQFDANTVNIRDAGNGKKYAFTPSTGVWYHFDFEWDGSNDHFFVNGTRINATSGSWLGTGFNINQELIFGTGHGKTSGWLNGYEDEIRISKGIARHIVGFIPTLFGYVSDYNTLLLMHFDSDLGNLGYRIFSNTAVTFSNSTTKIDTYSAYFNAASILTAENSPDWNFGSGDFTVDFWCKPQRGSPSNDTIFTIDKNASYTAGNYGVEGYIDSSGFMNVFFSDGTNQTHIISTFNIAGAWRHVAVVRNSATLSLYVDGNFQASANIGASSMMFDSNFKLNLGSRFGGSNYYQGWTDEFRISKGFARWTSNFSPQTTAYTTDVYTKLLMHFENNFNDDSLSSTVRTITAFGSASYTTAQKKVGAGSLALNGSTDYMYMPYTNEFNVGTGNFTVEFYVYLNTMPIGTNWPSDYTNWMTVFEVGTPGSATGYQVTIGATSLVLGAASSVISSGTHGMTSGNWYHVLVSRSSNTFVMYVNGNIVAITYSTTSFPATASTGVYIGCDSGQNCFVNGYVDEFRFSSGLARKSVNFTPSVAPYS